MKVKKILSLYRQQTKLDQPLLIKVLTSITNFPRKMDLKSEFRKIREIYDGYIEESKIIFDKTVKKYCEEVNAKNKETNGWKDLKSDEIKQIPPDYLPAYKEKIKALDESDIKVEIGMKFTAKEIEMSKIDIIEMEILDDFVDWDIPKEKLKKK